MDDLFTRYESGYWRWDRYIKSTVYISHVNRGQKHRASRLRSSILYPGTLVPDNSLRIRFRDIDLTDKNKFHKYFERKFSLHDPPVVILQDVKDVVLYSIEPDDLTLEMIDYLHLPMVDRFFRALIVYFQFFFQVWHKLMKRRIQATCHVWHPQVIKVENRIRDDLADLRSMVSKEYAAILLGLKEAERFYHMPDKGYPLSFGDKDIRMNDVLVQVSAKMVWVALSRPNFSHIEMELDRLTRTNAFNSFLYQTKRSKTFATTANETRILTGAADVVQKRLAAQSPLIKEALYGEHDSRMLALGQRCFPINDYRIQYLEIAYTAPETTLYDYGIKVGILGVPRKYFDYVLKRKRNALGAEISFDKLIMFKLPPRDPNSADKLPKTYPTRPPRYKPSADHQTCIDKQYKMWRNIVQYFD
ncbi:uncharacterized protein CBL_07698 [Carabus blaptoides fortunei]